MTELLSYDEAAREEVANILQDYPKTIAATILNRLFKENQKPWPVDGDELTKRRMK